MSETGHEYRKQYPIIRPSVLKELAHGICVSNLAFHTGKQMNCSEEMCRKLAIAGFLHDIGKLELARYVRGHDEETLIIAEEALDVDFSWAGALGYEIVKIKEYKTNKHVFLKVKEV